MDFIPSHLHNNMRVSDLTAHEHNQITFLIVQLMIIAMGCLFSLFVWLFC